MLELAAALLVIGIFSLIPLAYWLIREFVKWLINNGD